MYTLSDSRYIHILLVQGSPRLDTGLQLWCSKRVTPLDLLARLFYSARESQGLVYIQVGYVIGDSFLLCFGYCFSRRDY